MPTSEEYITELYKEMRPRVINNDTMAVVNGCLERESTARKRAIEEILKMDMQGLILTEAIRRLL